MGGKIAYGCRPGRNVPSPDGKRKSRPNRIKRFRLATRHAPSESKVRGTAYAVPEIGVST